MLVLTPFLAPHAPHAFGRHGMLPTVRRILVIRGGALGDGLLTSPALAALRTRWPQASITLIGPRTLLPFAASSGLADTALAIEDEAGLALMTDHGPAPAWSAADLGVVGLRDWRDVARRLECWGCARVLAGTSLPSGTAAVHVADHLFEALTPVGIGPCRRARPLVVPERGVAAANNWFRSHSALPRPIFALHPGSGGRHKCWPADRYAALAQRLVARGFGVMICLGPVETDDAPLWQAFAGQLPVSVAANVDLVTLAGLVRQCAGFVGNDAGVTHLAAALHVPTVAIFGPTDPARWAPLGRWVRVLRDRAWLASRSLAEGIDWRLSPPEVEQACVDLVAVAAAGGPDTKL
jgi:heptosyltransferase III